VVSVMSLPMFKYHAEEKKIKDHEGRVVGSVKNNRFTQDDCHDYYKTGLVVRELDQVSEALQRGGVAYL